MNLESKGFPVHLYAGRATAGTGDRSEEIIIEAEVTEPCSGSTCLGPEGQFVNLGPSDSTSRKGRSYRRCVDSIGRSDPKTKPSFLGRFRKFSSAARSTDEGIQLRNGSPGSISEDCHS